MAVMLCAVLSLALAGDPPGRTDPQSWASYELFGARFGMGPGDVLAVAPGLVKWDRLAILDVFLGKPEDQKPPSTELWRADGPFLGEQCVFSFYFSKGRLNRVEVGIKALESSTRMQAWEYRSLLKLMDSLGPPHHYSRDKPMTWLLDNKVKVSLRGALSFSEMSLGSNAPVGTFRRFDDAFDATP